MRSSKWESPYPLLSDERDDYTSGSFQIHEEDHSESNKDFTFNFRYELDCCGLEEYIKQGKAEIILHVASAAARFRNKYKFSPEGKNIKFSVEKDKLIRRVELTAYIISTGENDFFLPEHNKDYYGDTVFKVRKGDILAESVTVVIGLDDSELQKPLSSIFQLDEKEGVEFLEPVFSGEKIVIFLTPELYRKYDILKHEHINLRRTLSAIITLPVLVEAIEKMLTADESDQLKDLRWYRALEKRRCNILGNS